MSSRVDRPGYTTHRSARWLFRTAAFLTAIIAIAWPVLHYQPSAALAGELVISIVTGSILFGRAEHMLQPAPALTFAIQATGLAIASALSGSLLAIARLYAELPLVTTALLLASAVFSVFFPWRYGWAISLLLNASAIGLMISNSDNIGYY